MEDYLSPAFYLTSPLDQLTENTIYINQKNGYEGIRLFTTLAHEGFPGHLYQNLYFHSQDVPPIRLLLGYPGYTEGWADHRGITFLYLQRTVQRCCKTLRCKSGCNPESLRHCGYGDPL